uniref:Uncharacterized protein n=1 Tax=Glossina pallidipes TaxID=7398 RepID=A0A1A9Z2I9_GLOPL
NEEYPNCAEYCELSSIEDVKSAGFSFWWFESSIFQIDFNMYLRKDTIKIANNENNNNTVVILDTSYFGLNQMIMLTQTLWSHHFSCLILRVFKFHQIVVESSLHKRYLQLSAKYNFTEKG